MNISKITAGFTSIFLGFLIPVLNHGLTMIAGTIQNAGRMIGDESLEVYIWPKADIFNFLNRMPWIMWLYFLFMVGLGVYLIISGLKKTAQSGIEQTN